MSLEDEKDHNDGEERLSKEDMKRVSRYLSSSLNKIERKPFRVSLIFIMLISLTVFLGIISRLVEWRFI